MIPYALAAEAAVRLAVCDVSGHMVHTLLAERAPAGDHLVAWDGRDDKGLTVPSGVYYFRLTDGGLTATKALAVLEVRACAEGAARQQPPPAHLWRSAQK